MAEQWRCANICAADAAYRYAYQYDEVGNRLHEDRGQLCLDGRFNALNQLKALKFGGKLDIVGSVTGTNAPYTVKVDGQIATLYNSTNFLGGGRVKSGSNTISVVAMDASSNRTEFLRHVTFPPTNPETFGHDLNGNMTNDGQRAYFWDEENRLVAVETVTPLSERIRSEYLYDAQSRRIQKIVYSFWSNGAYTVTNTTRFVYDGWLLVQETQSGAGVSPATNLYVWGLDLSGSLQGAGGIGGLLSISATSPLPLTAYPIHDANGNITKIVSSTGTVIAAYVYDPYGGTISMSGPASTNNVFRFSSKYTDDETGLVYYGYRFYSPNLGRFLSRDPIAERGGLNLYAVCGNSPVHRWDPLGLAWNETICLEQCEKMMQKHCPCTSFTQAIKQYTICCGLAASDEKEGKKCVIAVVVKCVAVKRVMPIPWRWIF